jgi:hypothetical protein
MKSKYPDKYCNNCNEVTERYAVGNCKKCVKENRLKFIEKNEALNLFAKAKKDAGRPLFSKESYKKITIKSVIRDIKRNRNCFLYFLLNKNVLVYVGKSNSNILNRINEHIKDKDFDSVYYIALSSDNLLDEYEKKYIIKYKPKYNKTVYFRDVKVNILDLKTLEVYNWSKNELVENTGCALTTADALFCGRSKKVYNRYILEANRENQHTFKYILDTKTNEIERHSIITLSDKLGVRQNSLWYFFNGITKSYSKKRYVLHNPKS